MNVRRFCTILASVPAIVGVQLLCHALYVAHINLALLTFELSVWALTITQLVLRSGETDTAAIQRKLDAIIAGTDADDAVAGCEDL